MIKEILGKHTFIQFFHKQSILNGCFIYTNLKLTTLKFSAIFIVFSLDTGWNAFF